MIRIRHAAARAAIAAVLFAGLSTPALANEDSERILPNEEELQELSDLAQRWMRDFADKMAPMAERLKTLVDDIDAYEAPEMLPNGDIIIRRRPDAPPPPKAGEPEEGVAL